jgi:hypothetical protein
MPAELTQTINYTGLQQYIGEVQALLAPHRQKKKDPQKFANKIAAVVQKAYHLTRIGNEQPFMPAFAAEWISLFHNDGNLAKKFIYNPRSVFFPDKLKENFGNVPASKKTRANGGGALEVRETRVSGSSKAAVAPETATIGGGSEVIYKSQGISQAPPAGPSSVLSSGSLSKPRAKAPPSGSSAEPRAEESLSGRVGSPLALPLGSSAPEAEAPSLRLSARLSDAPAAEAQVLPVQRRAVVSGMEWNFLIENRNDLKSKLDRNNLKSDLEVCKEQIKIQDDLIARKNVLIAQYEGENILTTKLNEEKERLEKEKENLEKEKLDLIIELEKCELNLTNITHNNTIINKKNKKCKNDLKIVTAGLDLANKDELQKLINKNEEANQMLLKYRQEIDEKTTMFHNYQFEILELTEKNKHNLRVIEELKSQVDKNKIENENLDNQLAQESDKNFSLQNKLIDFKKNFGKNKLFNNKTIQDLYLQIINQTKELDKIKKELETCTNNLQACKTQNEQLKKELSVCKKGVKSNNEKISTVRLKSAPPKTSFTNLPPSLSFTNPPPSSIAASPLSSLSSASPPPSSSNTGPPLSLSATFSVARQKRYTGSPINPNYGYSNKSLTSQKRSRVKIPVNQILLQTTREDRREKRKKDLENVEEVKLNKTFFYPFNKTTKQKQICTPLGNNRLTIEQLKKIYIYYKNEMVERNKKLVQNLKMKSVEKDTPSYQEMCEDLQKLTKQQDDTCKREFIKKVQDAQSSATTTV